MTKKAAERTHFEDWARAIGVGADAVQAAWQDLQRRGLVSVRRGKVTISPLAMRRATSDVQRRLAAHLAGYVLTENAFIVRREGDPLGLPCILNTRIAVEQDVGMSAETPALGTLCARLLCVVAARVVGAVHYGVCLTHRILHLDERYEHE